MVGIFIDYDLIGGPVPALHNVVVECRDVPEETVEAEVFPGSARQHPLMSRSKTAAEVSVGPRSGHSVMRVAFAAIVSHPLIGCGVNVGDIRMARRRFAFLGYVIFSRGSSFLAM